MSNKPDSRSPAERSSEAYLLSCGDENHSTIVFVLREKWDSLIALLQRHRRVLVAFSGGCDSTVLLAAARRILGQKNVLAGTAMSASLPQSENEATRDLAARLAVAHRTLSTDVLHNQSCAANTFNAC